VEWKCQRCKEIIETTSPNIKIWWDENGTDSTKLMECPLCGKINVLKVIENKINPNEDIRFYIY